MVKPKVIFGLSQETSKTAITWNTPSQTVLADRRITPCALKYIDVTRTTDTTLYVMRNVLKITGPLMEKGNCRIKWTCVTRFIALNETPPDGYTWSGWRLTRKQSTSRPDKLWPEMRKHVSDASKRYEKQKWAIEKPKLDNAKRLCGIYFIDPEDEEFKPTEKMLVES